MSHYIMTGITREDLTEIVHRALDEKLALSVIHQEQHEWLAQFIEKENAKTLFYEEAKKTIMQWSITAMLTLASSYIIKHIFFK